MGDQILCSFLQSSSVSCKSWLFDSFGAFFRHFFEETTFQIVQLIMVIELSRVQFGLKSNA